MKINFNCKDFDFKGSVCWHFHQHVSSIRTFSDGVGSNVGFGIFTWYVSTRYIWSSQFKNIVFNMKFTNTSSKSRDWSNLQVACSYGMRLWHGIRLSPMFGYSSECWSGNWSHHWSIAKTRGMWFVRYIR